MLSVLWVLPALITVAVALSMRLEATKYPDAATAQRWKNRLWPTLFVGISVSLVIYAVLVRIEEDVTAFPNTITEPAPGVGHALAVRYPQMIRFDAPEINPLTLTIWFERQAGATPLTLTIELSSSSLRFIEPNSAGMSAEPRLTLTVDSRSLPQQVRMQPLASDGDERMIVDVTLRDATGRETLTKPLIIARETRTAFYWRVVKNRFFGDAGLALAVASAVLGIGWQLLNEGRQTRVGQQRERIREPYDVFERDLLEWALASQTLKQEAAKDWETQARYELHDVLKNQERQLKNVATQTRVKRLLHDGAEYYRAGDFQRCTTVLDLVIQVYASVYPELNDLPRHLPDARTADRQQTEAILHICGVLLHRFQTDAHELAAAALDALASQPDDHEAKKSLLQFISSPSNEPGAIELNKLALNDPRVRRRLTDRLPWTFVWPPIPVTPGAVTRTESVTAWLDANGLEIHPFDVHELQVHQPFLASVTLPEAQRTAIIQSQPLIVVGHRFDCHIAAVALSEELRRFYKPLPPSEQPMLVLVRLSDQNATGRNETLNSVVREAGTAWLRLIAEQPGVLLWLPDDEQALLAEWLVWVSGSSQALRQRLRRAGLKSGVQEQIILRRLDDLLTGIDTGAPHPEMFLNWLAIRPPGVNHMRLIVIHTGDTRAMSVADALSAVQDARVTWTLFTSPARGRTFAETHGVALEWSEDELLELLNVAVRSAGKSGKRLTSLMELDDLALNEEQFLLDTLKRARGSFERALAICQDALVHHLTRRPDQNDPKYLFLNENDFIVALLRN